MVKRISPLQSASAAVAGPRFQPNPITAAMLASLGALPTWAMAATVPNNITVHQTGGVNDTGTTITAVNATVSNITTTTQHGNTGFNSFGQFVVGSGNTVNLVLPGSTQNLVNLVHDARAEINGTLNGVLGNGQLGGNVIFADPHGLVVGSTGVVNVGSLTVTTPSAAQMQSLLNTAKSGSNADAVADSLMAGGYNDGSGDVKIQGAINTNGAINVFAAKAIVDAGASLQAGTKVAETVFKSTVNLQGVSIGESITQADGSVKIIGTNGVEVSGELAALMADNSGGNVTIKGGKTVALNGGTKIITTSKEAGGNSGAVFVQAPAITLSGNASINTSASGSGTAGDITVQALSDTSCEFCDDNSTVAADLSKVTPGRTLLDTTIGQANITIGKDVVLDASQASDGSKAGDITVQALSTDQQLAGWVSSHASVDVSGTFKGRNIAIEARSMAVIKPLWASSLLDLDANIEAFNDLSDLFNSYDTSKFKEQMNNDPDSFSELLALQDFVAISMISSDAKVKIGATADLQATADLNVRASSVRSISSTANGEVTGINTLIPFGLGVNYASLSGETSVEVASGAKLRAGDDLLLEAHSNNTMDLTTLSVNSHSAGDDPYTTTGLAFGMAQTDIDTHVTVAKGAVIKVDGDVTARSISEQDLSNKVSFEANGTGATGGPSVALAMYNSSTQTQFNADLSTFDTNKKADSLNVSALDLIYKQVNESEVKVGKSSSDFLKTKIKEPTISFISPLITKLLGVDPSKKQPTQGSKLRMGSAVTVSLAKHDAQALLGSAGSNALDVDVSGDVSVQALQYQGSLRSSAASEINSNVKEKDGTKYSLSVALVYSDLAQTTNALIGDNVTLKASHIGVGAKNEIPIIAPGALDFSDLGEWSSLSDYYENIKTLADLYGEVTSIPSQYASATGDAEKLGLAGAVSVMNTNITANAWVGDNSSLTTTGTGAWSSSLWQTQKDNKTITWTLQPDAWGSTAVTGNNWSAPVSLLAENRVERLAIAGNFDTVVFGSKSSKGSAVGAGLNIVLHDGKAVAGIGAGTQVTTDVLSVKAKEKDLFIAISPSAGKGPSVAANGALVMSLLDTTVNASVNNGATVKAGSVDIDADHVLGLWSAAGAVAFSEASGVGAGVAVNLLNTDVQALIGDNRQWRALSGTGQLGVTSTWNVDELSVKAVSQGQNSALSVAAGIARTQKEKQDAATANQAAGDAAGAKAQGLFDTITATFTAAWQGIKDAGDKVSALFNADPTRTGPVPKSALAVAGSASVIDARQTTKARLGDIVLDPRDPAKGSKVSVLALNQTHQLTGSGAGALTLAKGNMQSQSSSALSGAIAAAMLGNVTSAEVSNATLNKSDVLKVQAASDGDLIVMGLGLSVATSGSQSNEAVALSGSYGQFGNTTQATVQNSTVSGRQAAPGLIQVLAYDRSRSLLGGGAFSGSTGKGSAAGGAVTLGLFQNTISAAWLGSTASQFATLDVGAYSALQTLLASIGVAVSGGSGEATSGSFVGAYLDNQVSAKIDGYTPSGGTLKTSSLTGGAVNLEARSVSSLSDLDSQFNANASDTFADTGVDAEDTLGNVSVDADTSGGQKANSTQSLFDGKVSGEALLAIAGSVASSGKDSGGASMAIIVAGSDYLASMANVTTDLSGALNVEAYNATEALAIAVGAAGSGSGDGLVGSGTAIVDRGTVKAQILGTSAKHLTIGAESLNLTAQKAGGYYSLAGALAVSKDKALGAAIALSDIEQTVEARLQYADVTLDGDALIQAAQQSEVRTAAVAGATSGKATYTGSVTYNRIAGSTNALLANSVFTAKALNLQSAEPSLGASIWSLAGAVSASTGNSAVGAAVATNLLTGTRSAKLLDSTVNLSGDLNVLSSLDGEIYGIAVGVAGSSKGGLNLSSVNNVIQGSDTATIGNSTVTLTGTGDVTVKASSDSGLTIGSLAGSAGLAGKVSIGAASAYNEIAADRTASITSSTVTGFQNALVRSGADQQIDTLAITAGGAGDIAVNGAVTTSILKGTESALISDSTVTSDDLDVRVEGDRTINSLALTLSGSGKAAIGGADSNNLITQVRDAKISGSTLTIADLLTVQALGNMAVKSAALGAGIGGSVAAGASVAVNLLNGKDRATLSGVTLTGADTVKVLVEEGKATVDTLAGNVQGAGTGAGAGAVAVTQISQERTALVENSSLTLDPNANFTSLKISALTSAEINTLALSGAGAGTGAAVFSNTTNSIGAITTAALDTSKGSADNIAVNAKDQSTINALAGGAVAAGSVAVGVASAVNRITNQIEARLSGNKDLSTWAIKQLLVTAGSEATIEAASISAGFSGTAAVSAGVASNLIKTSVKALINAGALVKAQEDIGLLASNRDILRSGAMVVAGSGNAAVAGLVTVNQLESTTEAGISGSATKVDALGGGTNGLLVDDGVLTNAPDVNSWSDAQQFNPVLDLKTGLETVHGLAIRASSLQQLGQLSLSTAVSLTPIASAAVSGLSNTSLVGGKTTAYIDDAKINQTAGNASSANANQQVSVGASSHSFTFGGVFSGAVSLGAAAVAAAIDTVNMTRETTARLSGATLDSRGQTLVRANSTQAASDIVTTLGGGIVGVAGSGGVLVLKGTTQALVNNGSKLNVGSLKVNAAAVNRLSPNAGVLSAGAVGVGASVGYASNQSLVRAWIGDQTSPTTRTSIKGGQIDVAATTHTGVRANAISGSGAGTAVAGSSTVVMLENTTEAGVGYADLGTSSSYAGGLSVTAKDRLDALLTGGSVAIGAASYGGAASVLVANSATRAQVLNSTAYLANAMTVDAQREVDARLTTVTGGLAATSSVGGSIGLLLLGSGVLTQEGSNPLDELDNGGNGTLSQSDKLSSRSNANLDYQTVTVPTDGSRPTLDTASNSSDTARLNTAGSNVAVKSRLTDSVNYKQETVARVSASTVKVQGESKVTASDKLYSSNLAGSVVAGGGNAFGAGIAYTLSNARVIAEVIGGSLTTGSLSLSAIAQSLNTSPAVNVKAITGAGGLGIGLGAAVGVAVLNNLVNANLSGTVAATNALNASATDKQALDVQALGVTAGGLGGAGLVLGVAAHNSTVTTDVAASADLSGSDISLTSTSQAPVTLKAQGAAGGLLLGVNAAVITAKDLSSATVSVGNNAKLTASNALTVKAEASPQLKAESLGVSIGGLLSAGASVIDALAKAATSVTFGTGSQLQGKTANVSSLITQNGTNDTVNVHGFGVSGGIGLSANAIVANARNESTSLLQSQTSSRFVGVNGGDWTFASGVDVVQRASAEGYAGGYYAVGATVAQATADTSTQALVNGVFSGSIGTLNVSANSGVDNLASSVSGQGGLVSGAAAIAKTWDNSTTKAALYAVGTGGTAASFGGLNLAAYHLGTFNGFVNSVNAAILGASGAHATHSVNLTTTSELVGGSYITTKAYDQSARSDVVKPESSDFNVVSGSGGVVDAAAALSTSTIALNTLSKLGDSVRLTLAGDWRNPNHLKVQAYNYVYGRDKVKLDSGGAISIAKADSSINVSQSNASVNVGKNADIWSVGDVVLSASGLYDIDARANAKTYGLAGAAMGSSLAKVNATYNVLVDNNTKLFSYGDTKLYSGFDVSGAMNKATLTARTDLWNNTAFPVVNDPEAEANYQRSSNVTVNLGSSLRSVGDIYAYAGTGYGVLTGEGVGKDLYREAAAALINALGGSVSLDITGGKTVANAGLAKVTVNGTLETGVYSQQILHITGLKYLVNGVEVNPSSVNANTTGTLTVVPVFSQISDGITWNMTTGDYSQLLTARVAQLQTQLTNYGLSPLEKAAFQAELNLLNQTLAKLYTQMGGDASTGTLPSGLKVLILNVDPILARPGNIYVKGDQLLGSGALHAPGDAKIEIINDSAAFLSLAGLEIPNREGGQLLFNDTKMLNKAGISAANKGGATANFSVVEVAENSPAPVITVKNTYNPANSVSDAANLKMPAPDIYVQGAINNKRGLIDITASYGSIYANADIRGQTLKLTAGQDFVLNNLDAFTHIGGDPASNNANGVLTGPAAGSGVVAGNNVVINALYLNINGLVQSGVQDWSVTLNDANFAALDSLRAAWKRGGAAIVQLVASDARTGTIGYSYNFLTESVVLDKVEVAGGYMELTGHIMSTGNGQLKVLDGYSQVKVVNNTTRQLNITGIDLGTGVEGTLRINDVGRVAANPNDVWSTIYTRVGNAVQQYEGWSNAVKTTAQYLIKTVNGRDTSYNTTDGRTYVWLQGRDTSDTTTKVEYWDEFWGFVPTGDGTTLSLNTVKGASTPIEGAEYMGDVSNVPGGLASGAVKTQADERYATSGAEVIRKDMGGYCKKHFIWCQVYRTTRTTVTQQGFKEIDRYTVRADSDIAISFIGYDSGKIDLTSYGNVSLLGSLFNESGTTSITLNGGKALTQGSESVLISAKDLNLSAGSIGDAAQALRVQVGNNLSAYASNNIYLQGIKATGSAGLNLSRLQAGGTISVNTQGDLTANNGVVVSGQGISLQAAGNIGGANALLNLDTGSQSGSAMLKALAGGGIYVEETTGDLWLDQVLAGGDISIKVRNGDLLDGNTTVSYDERKLSEMQALWASMGLTGTQAADALATQKAALIEAGNQRYSQYWSKRGLSLDSNTGVWSANAFDANQALLNASQITQLKGLGWSDAQITAEQARRVADYTAMNNEFGGQSYNENYSYSLSATQLAQLNDTSSWTTDQLQYSIAASLLNRGSSSTATNEAMNIAGRNVTLQANRIGKLLDSDVQFDLSNGGGANLTTAQRAALAGAEQDDIYFDASNPLKFSVIQRDDVNVTATGTITATANGDIYLGGQQDFNVYNVKGQTVRIKTDGNIESANGSNVVVTGHDVVLEAGNGSIGATHGGFNTQIDGNLTARANLINLINHGDLSVQRLTGVDSLTLKVIGNLKAASQLGENLLGGSVNLTVTGDAGTLADRIQIGTGGVNDRIQLNVDGNAYIGGLQGNASQAGVLRMGDLNVGGVLDIGQTRDLLQSGDFSLGGLYLSLSGRWAMDSGTSVTTDNALFARVTGTATLGDLTTTGSNADLDIEAFSFAASDTGSVWQTENLLRLQSYGGDIGASSRYVTLSAHSLDVEATTGAIYANLASGIASGSLLSSGSQYLKSLGDLSLTSVISNNASVQLRGTGLVDIGSLKARNNLDLQGEDLNLGSAEATTGDLLVSLSGDLDATSLKAGGVWTHSSTNADVGSADIAGLVDLTLTGSLDLDQLDGDAGWNLHALNATIGNADLAGAVQQAVTGVLNMSSLKGGGTWNLDGHTSTVGTAEVVGAVDISQSGLLKLTSLTGHNTLVLEGTDAEIGSLAIGGTSDLTLSGDLKLASLQSGDDATLYLGTGSDIGTLDVTGDLDLNVAGVLDLDAATSTGNTVLHHRGVAGTALRYGDLDVGGALNVTGLGNWTGGDADVVGDATYDVGSADLASLTSSTGKLSLKAVGLFAADALDSDAQSIDLQSGSADLGVVNAFTTLTSLTNGNLTIGKAFSNGDMKLTTKPGSLGTIRFGVLADPLDPNVLAANNWHLKSGENLYVETDGDVFGGNAEANKQVTIKGRNLFFGRVQSLDEDVFLQATGLLAEHNGNITGLKVEAKRDVSIIANGDMSMPEVKFGGKYSLKAGRDLTVGVGGNLDLNGDAEAGRDLNFIIGGAVTLTNVTAGRDASIVSGKSITINNLVQAGGNVVLTAQDGAISVGDMANGTGGIISTGLPYDGVAQNGNVVLTATGNISTPTIVAGAGNIQATSGGELRVNDLASHSFIDLLARGLIEVKGTSSSVGNQTWRSTDDSIFFDRLLAGGQVLLDSLTNTQGRELSSDQATRINAGWRNGVASTASILLGSATAPSLSLWSGDVIRVADARLGNAVDMHGADIELYGRHTGAGQLNLWVEGSGDTNAKRFVTQLDAADIVSPRLRAVDSTITTSGERIDLRDASGVDFLKLYTSAATVLMDNLTPAYLPGADVQLYELDKAFQLKQDAITSTTDAYVLHRKYTHLVLLTNFSETHAATPAETGVTTQRTTAASFSEGQMSQGLAVQRLASILNSFKAGKAPEAQWVPNWSNMRMDSRMNLNDSQQPQYSVVPGQTDDGEAKWDL